MASVVAVNSSFLPLFPPQWVAMHLPLELSKYLQAYLRKGHLTFCGQSPEDAQTLHTSAGTVQES